MECFPAEMWNGFQPSQDSIAIFNIACQSGQISTLEGLSSEKLQQVRSRFQKYSQKWEILEIGETLEVEFVKSY